MRPKNCLRLDHGFKAGNTKGGSITVLLISCWTGLDLSDLQIKTKIVSCHTADSKPVKPEVNSTVILPPLYSLFKVTKLFSFVPDALEKLDRVGLQT